MAETKSKPEEKTKPASEPALPKIAAVTEPWNIFVDLMLHPKRFFSQATDEHLVEGAKVGIVSAVIGFLLGVASTIGVNWVLSDPHGAPVDEGAVWAAPITLLVILVVLAVEFLVSVGMARLLRGKGKLKAEALTFCCSLAPTFIWAIPFLGIFVAPFYQAVLFGRGLAQVDSISASRAYSSVVAGILVTLVVFSFVLTFIGVAANV